MRFLSLNDLTLVALSLLPALLLAFAVLRVAVAGSSEGGRRAAPGARRERPTPAEPVAEPDAELARAA